MWEKMLDDVRKDAMEKLGHLHLCKEMVIC